MEVRAFPAPVYHQIEKKETAKIYEKNYFPAFYKEEQHFPLIGFMLKYVRLGSWRLRQTQKVLKEKKKRRETRYVFLKRCRHLIFQWNDWISQFSFLYVQCSSDVGVMRKMHYSIQTLSKIQHWQIHRQPEQEVSVCMHVSLWCTKQTATRALEWKLQHF